MIKEKITATFLDADTITCEIKKPVCVDKWEIHGNTTPELTAQHIANSHVVFTNKVKIGEKELQTAKNLRIIIVAATGYDIIDLEACKKYNVQVANSPGYSVSSVPEHAVALMFALARSIVPLHNEAVDGTWSNSGLFYLNTHPIIELAGKKVGLIGSGSLGRATAKMCTALNMEVAFMKSPNRPKDDKIRFPLDELLARSDIISLHCPLHEENYHVFNDENFAKMKKGAFLINTARGALVDSNALIRTLESGHLAGAGIDVFDNEPPIKEHPLLNYTHPRLIISPHVAWASKEVLEKLVTLICATCNAFFAGKPTNIVSK